MAKSPDESIEAFPWRPRLSDLMGIVTLFAGSRIILILIGMVAWSEQNPDSFWRGKDRSGIRYSLVPDQPFLDMWTRWDSWEYEQIASEGYWFDFDHKPRPYGTVACFPFYPLLIRALGTILGGRYVVAGLVISNISALVGLVILFQWAMWWGDRRSAWLTISAAIAFPEGLFWSALYPQSLYFALSVGSLALMFDGRTALACLAASAATATRFEGLALIPTLFAIMMVKKRAQIRWDALWLLITPLGLASYMAYLEWRWGDPMLFMKVHEIFGRGLTNPFATLVQPLFQFDDTYAYAIRLTYVVGGFLIFGSWTRIRWPILLYGWLMFLIPLSTGIYISIYRVHLVNLPIYLAFGLGLGLRGRWHYLAWTLVALSAWFECGMMFAWVIGSFHP